MCFSACVMRLYAHEHAATLHHNEPAQYSGAGMLSTCTSSVPLRLTVYALPQPARQPFTFAARKPY